AARPEAWWADPNGRLLKSTVPRLSLRSGDDCSIGDFKSRVYPAAYLSIFAFGLAGGLLSLWGFVGVWRSQRSFTPVNLFMVNLLVSDLMLVCSLPFRATYYLMDSDWVFGDTLCRVMSYVFYINMYGSVYFLMALSVVRYVAITRPYLYRQNQKGRLAAVVCCVLWLLVSLPSIPMLFSGVRLDTIIALNYSATLFGFVLPFLVISVCYVFVVHTLLRRCRAQGTRTLRYNKSCSLVAVVLLIFLQSICSGGFGGSCEYVNGVRRAAVVTLCLAAANSCVDPILYFLVAENFQRFWQKTRRKLSTGDFGTALFTPSCGTTRPIPIPGSGSSPDESECYFNISRFFYCSGRGE
uniref:G-protein coupled receptors family 1 profile domain-containing protein n=1 Tax=Denticeps clupeoides TaxID=299321 RepID=A0AAY4D370_9TELE